MTKLNDTQERLLALLGAAKTIADERIAAEEDRMEDRKNKFREPVRKAAKAAAEAGVPARQIGFALETSDHKTIKAYIAGN